jgi:2-desacetyl-2-hydroxyethyl bacteriochlorophyllide A dehydrogenase
MKAAVLYGPRDIRVEEISTPEVGPGEILLRVRACGICGSDLHDYKGGRSAGYDLPNGGVIMGHELSGEVAKLGEGVKGLKVGEHILGWSFGGFAEYVKMPKVDIPQYQQKDICRPIPSNISFEEAATNEPLATSFHAVNLASPKYEDTIVMIGTGLIGLGVIQVLRSRCTARIIAISGSEKRLDMAKKMGADVVINRHQEDIFKALTRLTGSFRHPLYLADFPNFVNLTYCGIDSVFDCAGYLAQDKGPSPLLQAIYMVKFGGKVIEVAVCEKPVELDMNIVMVKEIELKGSLGWNGSEFRQSFELIKSGKVDRKSLITHTFPLSKAKEAFETQLNTKEAVKVIIVP